MKKQTKLLSVVFGLILFFASALVGCQKVNADISLIENTFYTHTIYAQSNSKVVENIVINFDVFNKTENEINGVITKVFQVCQVAKSMLEVKLNQKINANETTEVKSENFSVATERKGNKIAFTISFYTSDAWKFFNSFNNSDIRPEIVERIFDYTRIDRKDMIGTVVDIDGTEKYFGNHLKGLVFDKVNSEDNSLIGSLNILSVYAYATPYSRRKSNAPYIATYEGLYFHFWDTTNAGVEFKFWYNLARVESWYVLSLIIAFVTVIAVLLISRHKKEQKIIPVIFVENQRENQTQIKESEVSKEEKEIKQEENVAAKKPQIKKRATKKSLPKEQTKKRIKTKDE